MSKRIYTPLAPHALDILKRVLAEKNGNISAVSRLLVGSNSKRPALSMALRGQPFGDAKALGTLICERFDRVTCPHLKAEMPIADCRATWSGPTPTHDPAQLAHRRACRICPHKEAP